MALSGNSTKYNYNDNDYTTTKVPFSYMYSRLVWSGTQSISENCTYVTVEFILHTDTISKAKRADNTVTINAFGYTGTLPAKKLSEAGDHSFGSVTIKVPHSDEAIGRKSGTITAEWYCYPLNYSGKDLTEVGCQTDNITLDPITRNMTVSQSDDSITPNSITMNWSSSEDASHLWYQLNGTWVDAGAVSGKSGKYTIGGLSPNTGYSIMTKATRADSGYTENYSDNIISLYTYKTYSKVSSVAASDKAPTSFEVTCTSSDSGNTSSYEYSLCNSNKVVLSTNTSAFDTYTFSDLSTNTGYYVRCRVKSSDSGHWSDYVYSSLITTYKAYSVVNSVTVSEIQPFSCIAYCTSSDSGNTSSYEYSLCDSSKTVLNTYTSTQNNYAFSGLSENTTYYVKCRVKSTDSGQWSDYVYSGEFTTLEDQASIYVKVNGSWQKGKAYVKVSGEWVQAKKVYTKNNGSWVENVNT